MKKIIVAGLALVFLFTGSQSVFASGPFNGQSGDCNLGVGIGNYSKNNIPRNNNGCWTSTYINADAGDTVNVVMYYHNNTNNTLTNVRGSIVKSSSGPANTFTFTGTMYSDQGYQNIGTATLSLSSSQTLTYSATHIMSRASDVRADRDTSIVYNDDGQISIGNVPPGWNDYGEILVAFKVGNNNNNNICYDSSATNYGSYLPCNYNNNNYNYNNTPSLSTNTPTNITSSSATLNGSANGNGTTINSWIEFPCYGSRYDNKYSQSYSSLSASASNLSPNTTYTYCVVAQNNNQTYRGNSVKFTTLGNSNNVVVYTNNNIITTVATNVANNSATINGYISNPNYYNTNVYFEYGTSVNLGTVTVARNTNGVSAYNENLTGLSSDTIYFFRAVSQGPNGLIKGTIEIFRTLGATVARPIIVQGTTVIGTQSPIMLKIENRSPSIGKGDTIDYTITYKNIGKTTLTKPMLQVIVPKGITLINSTAGTYSSDTNTLTVPLEDLTAGKGGSVNLQGKIVSLPTDSAQIVSTAVLVYTNKSDAQENAMAYVLNTPKGITANSNNMLGASAFFGGIFPTSLVGWLILTILIMLLVMIARTFYRRQPAHAEATH